MFIGVAAVFICAPTKYMQSFFNGLTVWAYNVVPALFPFTVLTTIALKLKPRTKHSVTKLLFGISCDNIFLTSLLCGYPIGAKAIADSNADNVAAVRMSAFCSSAGPIFMIATVGATLLQSTTATVIVVSSHILSVIANGLVYRRKDTYELLDNDTNFNAADFGNTIINSALSIISVGGLIALFYMLSDMIRNILPTTVNDSLVLSFAIGLLEMTNGVFGVCKLTDVATATVLCSTLLAFGGMCVFLQCYAFLGKKNVKAIDIIKTKLTQAAFATIISFVLVKIFL